MTGNSQLRPEILLGPNPFLEALPPLIRFNELPKKLMRTPLNEVPWRTLDAADREIYLNLSQILFALTS